MSEKIQVATRVQPIEKETILKIVIALLVVCKIVFMVFKIYVLNNV